MSRVLSDTQVAAYNRGVSHLIKAFDTLGNVKVIGWQPHVLLYEVSNEMLLAMESLADVSSNDLAPQSRIFIGIENAGQGWRRR